MVLLTMLESAATSLLEWGGYFYAHERMGFSKAQNLWLALVFGGMYVAGALASHPVSVRLREKRLLGIAIGVQLAVYVVLGLWVVPAVLFVGMGVLGLINGLKWPVIESYVSAGHPPREMARAIGRFNVSWSAVIPLCLVISGPILMVWPGGIFVLGAVLSAASLWLMRPLRPRPVHLAADDPTRPRQREMLRLRVLVVSSRWLLLMGYSLMWILGAVLPQVLSELGVAVAWATGLAGVLHLLRFGAFVVLGLWTAWHGRLWPLVVGLVGLPLGFFLAVFAPDLAAAAHAGLGGAFVLMGEVIFGAAVGVTYYGALYYGMLIKNASVDAGGAHESLIGTGFVIGPVVGLIGIRLSGVLGGEVPGMLAAVAPLLLLCTAGACRPIVRARRMILRRRPL